MPDHQQLEINQDLAFQRREWSVQRVGRWALAAFVVAAAVGLFGKGPLTQGQAGAPGTTLWIDYDRFVRVGTATRVYVNTQGAADSSGAGLRLRVNREYFDSVRLEHVSPEPAALEIGARDVYLQFSPHTSAAGPVTIVLDIEPLQAGRNAAQFSTGTGAQVGFTQFSFF